MRAGFVILCLLLWAAPTAAQKRESVKELIERYKVAKGGKAQKKIRAQLLQQAGPDDIPYLAKALMTGEKQRVRRLAGFTLKAMDNEDAHAALVYCLDAPVKQIRQDATWALGTGAPTCLEELADVLQTDDDPVTRILAVVGIARIAPDDEDALPPLVAALENDPDPKVRGYAAWFLTKAGSGAAPAVPALIRALQEDESYEVRGKAAAALGQLGEVAAPAVPALAQATSAEIFGERLAAVEALENLGPVAESATPQLIAALDDPEAEVRRSAVSALGRQVANDDVNDALLAKLHDWDRLVRRGAAERLGDLYGEGSWVVILRGLWPEALGLLLILAAWFGIFARWPRRRPRSSIKHGLLVALIINGSLIIVPAYVALVAIIHGDWVIDLAERLSPAPLLLSLVCFVLLMLTCLGLSLWISGRRKRAPRMEGDEDDLDEPLPGVSPRTAASP